MFNDESEPEFEDGHDDYSIGKKRPSDHSETTPSSTFRGGRPVSKRFRPEQVLKELNVSCGSQGQLKTPASRTKKKHVRRPVLDSDPDQEYGPPATPSAHGPRSTRTREQTETPVGRRQRADFIDSYSDPENDPPATLSSSAPQTPRMPREPDGIQPGLSDSTPSPALQHAESNVEAAIKKLTSLVTTVVQRLDHIEEQISQSMTSSSDSCSSSKKRLKKSKDSVPLIIRSEVRKTYNLLLQDLENDFQGFDLNPSVPFNGATNEGVVKKLLKEVTASNPQFQACDIRAAAYTYYRSIKQDESLRKRGLIQKRNQARRRRERMIRKLQERSALLEKADILPKDKEKWKKVLRSELISSEESSTDLENDEIFVKPIPWRAERVTQFFADIDAKNMQIKSSQAHRQRKARKISVTESTRPIPDGLPKWAIN